MSEAEVADHAFLGGRLLLREPKRGHRSGTDAVLLAMAAPLQPGQHLIDIGAGAGAAALAVLCRVPDTTATLIEREPEMALLARHNLIANGFADRAQVIQADIATLDPARDLGGRLGNVVISNPPFYLAGTTRVSQVPQKANSHVLDGMGHGEWARHVLRMAQPRGHVLIVHRPEALSALLSSMDGRAAVRLRIIYPRDNAAATRLLLHASVGRRSPMTIEAPLSLHDASGRFTPWVEALHRGEGNL